MSGKNQEPYNDEAQYTCMHCQLHISSIKDVPAHSCFLGKNVYKLSDNVLYTPEYTPVINDSNHSAVMHENVGSDEEATEDTPSNCDKIKDPAVRTDRAIMALLSLYEAHKGMFDNPKRQGKLWSAISYGLLEAFGIEMSKDQVRWKMNALHKKYKDIVDNNSKSGRAAIEFRWFTEMEGIFGKQREDAAAASHTASSGFSFIQGKLGGSLNKAFAQKRKESQKNTQAALSQSVLRKEIDTDAGACSSSTLAAGQSHVNNSAAGKLRSNTSSVDAKLNKDTRMTKSSLSEKRVRHPHGSGSNLSRAKLQLENQWLVHLSNKEKRDAALDQRYAKLAERKKDELQSKKRNFAMKEKDLELRKQIAENKLKATADRNAQLLQLENEKCE